MKITGLKLNGITNPIGFSYEKLLCSWKVTNTEAKYQKHAKIEVSLNSNFQQIYYVKEGADLTSNETELFMDLQPYTTYYWRVTVVGDNDECATSDVNFFETGKMDEAWSAKWIRTETEDRFHPVFKKEFTSNKKIVKARLYICGLGLYEAYVNGEKAGNEFLAPFLNDYKECYQYQTYDVTSSIQEKNCMEIFLGKGWYMGVFGLQNKPNLFGDYMTTIAELHLTYEDGTTEVVATDDSWSYRGSDVEESGIYYGETYNHLLWENQSNDWKVAKIAEAPGKLVERYSIPVVVKEQLQAVEIIHTPAGETVVDFGQNHAGYMEFEADFPAGTKIVMECAEILQNGNFYHDNYRDAESAFTYISNGTKERVRPHFTYFGYRYLKVTGWPKELKETDIIANVVYSDLERTGYIETSNTRINRLYENCLWSQKSNFIDLPTDCPQRSERLGWTGDAQVFAQTASYNMDTKAFFRKFLRDLRSEQVRMNGGVPNYIPSLGDLGGVASVWGDVGTFMPDMIYRTFGTLQDVAGYYPLMRDWVEYMYQVDEEKGGKRLFLNGFQFGDWLALDGVTESSFKGSTDDDYIGTVYYYQSTKLLADMAYRLGKEEDEKRYRKLEGEIKDAIMHEYFSPSGRLALDTQASYIIALKFGLYIDKEKLINQFKDRLKKDCYEIKCGFVGAPLLCMTLCENGMEELAYHFLFKNGFPGWMYAVDMGATTIWERWNSVMPDGSMSPTGMNSLNHYSYGSVVEFFYAYIAGIRATEPGYRKAIIAPTPDMRFRYFNCSYDSAYGKYVSNWSIAKDGTFSLHVEIPFNCEAQVVLPRYSKGDGVMTLTAGSYDFSYMPSKDYRKRYDANTRLLEVAEDAEVMEILREKLPAAFGMIMGRDKENGNLTFGELGFMFFMGFHPQLVAEATKDIYEMIRW